MNCSEAEIRYVNHCCLFLDVILVADITDASGTMIVNEAYTRTKACKLSTELNPTYTQSLPSHASWNAWKKIVQLMIIPKRRELKSSLGPWMVIASEIRVEYKMYRTEKQLLFD